MARWRLTAPHYLNTEGIEYEHRELNTDTGVQARKIFLVPILLDPNTPGNSQRAPNGEGGAYIVCHKGKGAPRDIILVGDPTPDMEPLDDEARAISESFAGKWKHPIDSIGNEDYGATVAANFERQMTALFNKVGGAVSPATSGVNADDFAKLQEQVAALMAKNEELEGKLAKRRA